MHEEGVIKFDLRFDNAPPLSPNTLSELNAWRSILWKLGLIGQDPERYGGYGFGNVSQRIGPLAAAAGHRQFVISGTQTAHLGVLDAAHYATVQHYDPEQNRVLANGPVRPSSESLTHGMIYDMDANIHVILHVHAPAIWESALALGIPVTDAAVAYGTPAMAHEVKRLFDATAVRHKGIFCMGGHADGVMAFGVTAGEAGCTLLSALAASYALNVPGDPAVRD